MPARWGPVLDLAIAKGLITQEIGDRLRRVVRPEAPIEEFVQVTGVPELLVRGLDQEAHAPPPKARNDSSAHADLANALLTPTVSPDALHTDLQRSPDHVGRYPILGLLGRGAMGAVYKAYDPSLHRAIALKTMSGSATEEDPEVAAKRFVREAQSVAKLRHPGIVCVHEQGSEDGTLYFTMDLVEGKSFAQALRDGSLTGPSKVTRPPSPSAPTVAQSPSGAMPASPEPSRLPLRKAVEVLAQVGEAMGYAHAQGIVHRDLKPANILIDRRGRAYVSDFGLAKVSQASLELTKSQAMMGTAYYMSPEQCAGRSREVTPASDVFALGVILYESLTGQRPFTGESAPEIVTRIQSEEPTRPRRVNASIPQDLETVCLKALDKSPSGRYPTGKEFAADLQRHLNGKQVRARPPSRTGRIVRELGRVRSAVWGLLVALLLAIVVVPVLLLSGAKRQQPATSSGANDAAMSYEKILATIHPQTARDWLAFSETCRQHQLNKEADESLEKASDMDPTDVEITRRLAGILADRRRDLESREEELKRRQIAPFETMLKVLDAGSDTYADRVFEIGEKAEAAGFQKYANGLYVLIAGDGASNRGVSPRHPGANKKLGRILTPWGDYEDADLVKSIAEKAQDPTQERKLLEGLTAWQRSAYNVKKRVESRVGSKCQCVTEQPYLIVVQEGPTYSAEIIAEDFREKLHALYKIFRREYADKFKITELFEKGDEVLPLIIYDSRDTYFKQNPDIPEWAGGHFDVQTGDIQSFRGVDDPFERIFHEGTHQLIASATKLLGGKDTNTLWLSEGIACYFEAFKRDAQLQVQPGAVSEKYLPEIQVYVKKGKQFPFEEFLDRSYERFWEEQEAIKNSFKRQEFVGLSYAQAWSLVYFLRNYDGGKYKDRFAEYLKLELQGKGGLEAFRSTFGDLHVLEREWVDYVGTLKPG